MKIQGNPKQGSFGIPPEMQAAHQRQMEQRARRENPPNEESEDETASDEEPDTTETDTPVEGETPKEEETKFPIEGLVHGEDPRSILSGLGAELTDDDIHDLIFRGCVEKDINAFYDPKEKGWVTARFKTLTTFEADAADAMLASEVNTRNMTRDGYDSRRAMIVLAFAVTHIQGRPVVTPVFRKSSKGQQEEDIRATAAKRLDDALSQMSCIITSQLSRIHAALTLVCNQAMRDMEKRLLKK